MITSNIWPYTIKLMKQPFTISFFNHIRCIQLSFNSASVEWVLPVADKTLYVLNPNRGTWEVSYIPTSIHNWVINILLTISHCLDYWLAFLISPFQVWETLRSVSTHLLKWTSALTWVKTVILVRKLTANDSTLAYKSNSLSSYSCYANRVSLYPVNVVIQNKLQYFSLSLLNHGNIIVPVFYSTHMKWWAYVLMIFLCISTGQRR